MDRVGTPLAAARLSSLARCWAIPPCLPARQGESHSASPVCPAPGTHTRTLRGQTRELMSQPGLCERRKTLGPHSLPLLGGSVGLGRAKEAALPASVWVALRFLLTPFLPHLSNPVLFPGLQTQNSSCPMMSQPPREILGHVQIQALFPPSVVASAGGGVGQLQANMVFL